MSDRVNDELLSAYLDNEVTDEERAKVERALADSPETRTSFESLKQVQARLRAIPRFTLADDFHERVVREAERRCATQGVATDTAGSAVTANWLRFATIAASVAAVLVVALVIAINQRGEEIVKNPNPNRTDLVQEDSLPPPVHPVSIPQRPEPESVLVYDLAITSQGQIEDAFGKIVRQAGVAFDPRKAGVQLGEDLRTDLLESRFTAGVNETGVDRVNDPFDVVDMVYVQGTGPQIDEIYANLCRHEQIRIVLDYAMKPETSRVLNSLGERSWLLAESESAGSPGSYAYRLDIGITLHSSRSGFLARFPTPGLNVRLVPNGTKSGRSVSGSNPPIPPNPDLGGNQPKQGEVKLNAEGVVIVPFCEILVIRRNLNRGFPENAQKPGVK
ncbi:MAG TPA: zf-HC2 domain-containing protein [Pirellulaceae bacterium]|nr:zf-HC2 domain-containing protein [Pirellulaceae bacterium]